MRITVVGAGAMGGSYGGHLFKAGHEVRLIDTWRDHVDAIARNGLTIRDPNGDVNVKVPAATNADFEDWAELVITFIDTNNTTNATTTIDRVLAPDGAILTMQNGIGNVEALADALGAERVIGGSSMCSAAVVGPGEVALTHRDVSSIGEVGGEKSARVQAIAEVLTSAGFDVAIKDDIMAVIWKKFLVNCGINALCAVSGLRTGEMTRIPEMFALQGHVIDEALAITAAKGIDLDPDIRETIQKAAHYRFNKPSMLQHVSVGRKTEIDAINGALIREAKQLGIATPYNEALVALLKGREMSQMRAIHESDLDYAAWEARIANEPLPTE